MDTPNNEIPDELLAQLVAFTLDEEANVMRLPVSLTSEERKKIHNWCEDNFSDVIEHESVGYGNKRYLILRKLESGEVEKIFAHSLVDQHRSPKKDLNKKSRSKDNQNNNNNNNTDDDNDNYCSNNNNYNCNNNNYKSRNVCILDIIPPEIFMHIFKYCDCVALNRLALCSTYFRDSVFDQSIWKLLCKFTFPSMFNSIMTQDSEVDWKVAYMMRHMKQRQWDSKKQKFPRATEFGSNNNNNNNNSAGARLKTCKRCHERFNPNNNPPTACTYHPGIFAHKDNCSTCNSRNDVKGKKVQKSALDERINRKLRHSTKTNVNYTFVTVHGECQFEYTCCGQKLSGVIGCKQACHK